MLTVTKLASALGVSADVIRHYTDIGLLKPLTSPFNGYRYYDETDALAVANARVARSLDFSLKESSAFIAKPITEQKELLKQRESEIETQIFQLQEKQARLRKIRTFLEKTDLCTGVVEDVYRRPIFSLYTFNGLKTADPKILSLARAWMDKLPYTHISVSLSKDELNDPDFKGPYRVRFGIGVTDEYATESGLNLEPPVETVPGGRFLIIYLRSFDLLSLSSKDLKPLLDKARELGATFLNDTTGRLLAIEENKQGSLYYVLIRVRIG